MYNKMKQILSNILYFLLEILFYFGSSFVVITRLITKLVIGIFHLASNLFWLTIYGTPALIIIFITSIIFACRWIKKTTAGLFSANGLQRTISFTSSK